MNLSLSLSLSNVDTDLYNNATVANSTLVAVSWVKRINEGGEYVSPFPIFMRCKHYCESARIPCFESAERTEQNIKPYSSPHHRILLDCNPFPSAYPFISLALLLSLPLCALISQNINNNNNNNNNNNKTGTRRSCTNFSTTTECNYCTPC